MKTFNQWSAAGYQILKGSKGIRGNDGQWYFTENQVRYTRRASFNSTFKGCAPKGTGQLWGDLDEDDPEYLDNPLTHDWVGRPY